MDVTLLKHFAQVAEELHFSRAAKTLNISRQALSKSVKQLEAELGVELFDRSADTTQLTDAGRALLADARAGIAEERLRVEAVAEAEAAPSSLAIAFVPGVTVGKWTLAWEKRHPTVALRFAPGTEDDAVSVLWDGIADLSFVRLPVVRKGLSVIPLYEETTVVVAPKDHPIAAFDSLTLADLADESIARDPESVPDAVELVAAGVGVLLLPQSVARLHTRKDVVARPVTDAPTTEIAIAWIEDDLTAPMEEFVGIVRGRTVASSRASGTVDAPARAQKETSGSSAQNKEQKKDPKKKPAAKNTAAAIRSGIVRPAPHVRRAEKAKKKRGIR